MLNPKVFVYSWIFKQCFTFVLYQREYFSIIRCLLLIKTWEEMCVKRCVKNMFSLIFMDTVEIFVNKLFFPTLEYKLSNYVLSRIFS